MASTLLSSPCRSSQCFNLMINIPCEEPLPDPIPNPAILLKLSICGIVFSSFSTLSIILAVSANVLPAGASRLTNIEPVSSEGTSPVLVVLIR